MSEMVRYRVKRAFNYGGHRYKQGDIWTPGGSRWDDSIISNKLVTIERVRADELEAEAQATVKRGVKK